jgi:hypothetical protein
MSDLLAVYKRNLGTGYDYVDLETSVRMPDCKTWRLVRSGLLLAFEAPDPRGRENHRP